MSKEKKEEENRIVALSKETNLTASEVGIYFDMLRDLSRRDSGITPVFETKWVQDYIGALNSKPIDFNNVALYGGYIALKSMEKLCDLNGIDPTVRRVKKESEGEIKYPFKVIELLRENGIIDVAQANYGAGVLIEHRKAEIEQIVDPKDVFANFGSTFIFVEKVHSKMFGSIFLEEKYT